MKKTIKGLFTTLCAGVAIASVLVACGVTPEEKPEEETPKTAPTGLMLGNLTGTADDPEDTGEGTISVPYTVTLNTGATREHNMTVRPAGADTAFAWTVGTIEGEQFTASETSTVTVTQNDAKLTVNAGDTAGEYYVRGVAETGELTVYLKVTVNEYVPLTGITLDGFEKVENQDYDYYIKTAKGTNWDVGAGITERGQKLLDGEIFGGNQKPLHLNYFGNVYKFDFKATPANATNDEFILTPADKTIFEANSDGTWTAKAAGETIVTVTNSENEASVKLKVEVVDTIYPGILKSAYDAVTAKTDLDWYFDGNADDKPGTLAKLDAWNIVMNKTTSHIDGDDGNQKAFYLGDPDRPYGIDLESRIDSNTPVSTSDTLALAWTKAVIAAGANKLYAFIGNNNKTFGKYRIMMVDGEGNTYPVTDGWQEQGADGSGTRYDFDVPAGAKGKTVAIVIESALNTKGENYELHIKGVWIDLPITRVAFKEQEVTVTQGSTFTPELIINPSKVIDDRMTYSVTSGDASKITFESGEITVAKDAPIGDYTIKVASQADPTVTATLALKVEAYVDLTAFTAQYAQRSGAKADLAGAEFNEKQGATPYVLDFGYAPDNASVKGFDVAYGTEGVAIVKTTTEDNVTTHTLEFRNPGTTTVTITPKAEEGASMAVTFNVTVRAGQVLNWANKDAILKTEGGWTKAGDGDSGVGEGVDLNGTSSDVENKGRISYSVNLKEKDMNTLALGVRSFVRSGETNCLMYVSVTKEDGSTKRILASNYEYATGTDTIKVVNSDTEDPDKKFERRNEFIFDLGEFADLDEDVTITIGVDDGTHCVIMDVKLS